MRRRTQTPSTLRLSRLQQCCAIGVAFLVAAAALEMAVRICTYSPPNVLAASKNPMGTYYFSSEPIHNPGPLGDLVPGETLWLLWPSHPYLATVNHQGLRNEEEVNPQAFRILALGDSMTFGPYVANRETWPALLEADLRRAIPEPPIQVLNAGVPGYSIPQEYGYLKEKGLRLQPQLVILAVHMNDIIGMARRKQEEFPRPSPRSMTLTSWLTRHSAFFHILRALAVDMRIQRVKTAKHATKDADTHEVLDPYYEEYRHDFQELAQLLKQEKVPLAVFIFPDYTQVPTHACPNKEQQFLKDLAGTANVPFLDLIPVFRDYSIEDLFLLHYEAAPPVDPAHCFPEHARYVGNGHLSRFGYQITARAILAWLRSHQLVPQPKEKADPP